MRLFELPAAGFEGGAIGEEVVQLLDRRAAARIAAQFRGIERVAEGKLDEDMVALRGREEREKLFIADKVDKPKLGLRLPVVLAAARGLGYESAHEDLEARVSARDKVGDFGGASALDADEDAVLAEVNTELLELARLEDVEANAAREEILGKRAREELIGVAVETARAVRRFVVVSSELKHPPFADIVIKAQAILPLRERSALGHMRRV